MNLRELRKEAGLTQAELASRLGMSYTYIYQLESGKRTLGRNMQRRILEAIQGPGVVYSPPVVPFESEKQKKDLRRMWLEGGYGSE